MSQMKIDSEDIAEIRNALQIIQGNAQILFRRIPYNLHLLNKPLDIINEVKRIDKLLPQVKFEGKK